MSDSPDAQLLLKKRARRRLVGAVAFAGLAAVILPMVMDEEPKQQTQDIQIRIPGQNQGPLQPPLKPPAVEQPTVPSAADTAEPPARSPEKPIEKAPDKTTDKPAAKPADKKPPKPVDKAAEKPAAVPTATDQDTQRAAAILGVKPNGEPAAANGGGQFIVQIGAFSNPANVKQLQGKLGELGIKSYSEAAGDKTRVRAGPFTSREAAEKALEKMKRIGVNGAVAAKQ